MGLLSDAHTLYPRFCRQEDIKEVRSTHTLYPAKCVKVEVHGGPGRLAGVAQLSDVVDAQLRLAEAAGTFRQVCNDVSVCWLIANHNNIGLSMMKPRKIGGSWCCIEHWLVLFVCLLQMTDVIRVTIAIDATVMWRCSATRADVWVDVSCTRTTVHYMV